MPFDSIVFDLDGTLWDTTPACVVAWNRCIERLGIGFRPIVEEDVRQVTGKAHDECIRLTFQGLDEEEIQALIRMTEEEDVNVIEELGGQLYPGVDEGLRELHERYRLFIVSNCQAGYIETFLRHSGFGPLFEDFECFGNTKRSKSHNLGQLIERNGLQSPLMVGDASGDETAAKDCGIPFHFVSYGFGQSICPDHTHISFTGFTRHLLASPSEK